jgi:putative transposase
MRLGRMHALYNTKYHLVWIPKYRKRILCGDIRKCVKQIFEEIADTHCFEIDMMEVADDHVHINIDKNDLKYIT